ncbi:hypothetical protein AC249_AIPGENE26535 [Exaiptasia diaphana]|nr:hypothetical protein AC249_AIPGENE26535 [Exaiptasia diaphana]
MSGLLHQMDQYAISPALELLCVYGDSAYPLKVHLQTPFQNAQLTAAQQAFNMSMSSVRIAVEWVFADISTYFAFMDFRRNLKIGLSPVGKMYIICSLLRNALTCFYEEVKNLQDKVDDLENRSRRNNLCFDGIEESVGESWSQTEEKVKQVMSNKLDISEAEEVVIERAHRVEARQMGKTAYFSYDKLIIRDQPFMQSGPYFHPRGRGYGLFRGRGRGDPTRVHNYHEDSTNNFIDHTSNDSASGLTDE